MAAQNVERIVLPDEVQRLKTLVFEQLDRDMLQIEKELRCCKLNSDVQYALDRLAERKVARNNFEVEHKVKQYDDVIGHIHKRNYQRVRHDTLIVTEVTTFSSDVYYIMKDTLRYVAIYAALAFVSKKFKL